MIITDSQVHIWGANSPERPWPQWGIGHAQREVPLGAEELIGVMDTAGVSRVVIVPPSWEGNRNDLALAAAAAYPGRFAVMGRLSLQDPSSVDLTRWLEQPGMLGVRLTFHTDTTVEDAQWFWPAAASAAVPVMVYGPGQTSAFGEIARLHPDLKIVIDHLNIPTTARAGELAAAIEPLLALGGLDNVAVKVSALPCVTDEGYPFPGLAPHVRRVVDAFGAERCMWGSDLSRLPCPYSDWVNAMADGLGVLSSDEVQWVMGRSLAAWLNWPEPPAS